MELEKGSHVRVVTAESDKDKTDGKIIWVDYPNLPKVLKKGDKMFIDDGLIGLKVLETGITHAVDFYKAMYPLAAVTAMKYIILLSFSAGADWVDTVVEAGGLLCSRKGVNLPGCDLIGLKAVSDRDEADLRFGVAQGIDMVFASFIRSAQDVKDVRRALGPHGRDIKVISKVESRQGVQK